MSDRYALETARIGLRPFAGHDAAALARVFADPYAARFSPEMSDISQAARWITRSVERYATDGFGLWAARLHTRSRRFQRLGDRYYLFYTDRGDWGGADRGDAPPPGEGEGLCTSTRRI